MPASRGVFETHVLCVRDVRAEEASGHASSKWKLGALGAKKKTAAEKLANTATLAATVITEALPGFPTFELHVAPLGPDASMSIVMNASRWHSAKLLAGTRLVLMMELRDRFGNPCKYALPSMARC